MKKIVQAPPIEKLTAFEAVSWPRNERASEKALSRRLAEYPEGIFLLSIEGKDVAQVTVSPKRIPKKITTFEQMRDIPVDRKSRQLWITNMATACSFRGKRHMTCLLQEVIRWAISRQYESMSAVISCHGYSKLKEDGATIEEYISKGGNPALRAIQRAAEIIEGVLVNYFDPIPNYWEENRASQGYGILVTVDLNIKLPP